MKYAKRSKSVNIKLSELCGFVGKAFEFSQKGAKPGLKNQNSKKRIKTLSSHK
jgi:hypothetical protein